MSSIEERLERIESLLQRLVGPIINEEARQLLTCTSEQRKAHNKRVMASAKANYRGKTV